jgi:hypothetical protein
LSSRLSSFTSFNLSCFVFPFLSFSLRIFPTQCWMVSLPHKNV